MSEPTPTPIQAATVLELFEGHPERWTKASFARTASGRPIGPIQDNATCWCLLGAIKKVYGIGCRDAIHARVYRRIASCISKFNDEHTFDEVLDLVREAGI